MGIGVVLGLTGLRSLKVRVEGGGTWLFVGGVIITVSKV